MYQMQIESAGGADSFRQVQVDAPQPAANEVVVRHHAIGFNMIDTYHRKGLYPLAMPAVLGIEAAGEVIAVGANATTFAVGDRVVYMAAPGCYCEQRAVAEDQLVALPDSISYEMAAACFMKGLTTWALASQTFALKAGDKALIYAATGGVGSLLCQWALHLDVEVIAVVGNAQKAEKAKAMGCDVVINRNEEDVLDAVKAATAGEGVNVVYDSLGQATFDQSLDCLRRLGTMVSYGNATGAVEPVNILMLMLKGSLSLVRPQVHSYIATRSELESGANALFQMLSSGKLLVEIGQQIALADVGDAHRLVESQQTSGSIVLLP